MAKAAKVLMGNRKYCLALDLKNDEELIQEYKRYHKQVWPEVLDSIRSSGIENMEIYNVGNRLFMIMTVNDKFSFEKKALSDDGNPKVQEWESMMWKYQQALPFAVSGEKWMLMERIFQIESSISS